jgi:6-phosphogluconolactonase
MQGELGPDAGAEAYAAELGDDPQFELMLLGLGPDAHIASLFPGRPERRVRDRLVVGVPEAGMEPYVPRISLTFPAIDSARRKVFLVTGAGKTEAVQRAFGDHPDPELLAAQLQPVTVYADPAAAGR